MTIFFPKKAFMFLEISDISSHWLAINYLVEEIVMFLTFPGDTRLETLDSIKVNFNEIKM